MTILHTKRTKELCNADCPLCGSHRAHLLWRKADAQYVRCTSCGLIFQYPLPTAEQIGRIYDESYYVKQDDGPIDIGYKNYLAYDDLTLAREIFRVVDRLGDGQSRRLLDIGCATGNLLEVAREHGWEASGIEVSAWSAQIARNKGFTVYNKPLEVCNIPPDSFDAVTLFDVIEHIPNPVAELRYIWGILKTGGTLIMETPNIESFSVRFVYGSKSELVQPHAHLVLFSRRTLTMAMEQIGFRDIRMTTMPLSRTFKRYVNMLVARLAKKVMSRLKYRIGPFNVSRFIKQPNETKLPSITVDDCMQVIARKM